MSWEMLESRKCQEESVNFKNCRRKPMELRKCREKLSN